MGSYERNIIGRRRRIAIVGSGISGLSAAWLLSQRHEVTVFEAADRIGGHSNTVVFEADGGEPIAVDTGFIVYNEVTYPNLTALFDLLNVPTSASDMSFAVSLDDGAFEYAGGGNRLGLFARKLNIVSPRFWTMMRDLLRFYRTAPGDLATMGDVSLRDYLAKNRYSRAFCNDHLYPMSAAIWSTPAMEVGAYPAASFIRFCCNHGLLELRNRPTWRTVKGGSRHYIERITSGFRDRIKLSTPVSAVLRRDVGVEIVDAQGARHGFDDVVIATHADQALRILPDASADERRMLGAFRYSRNEAVLHRDARLMPKRRAAWSSWNYVGRSSADVSRPSITYWMNRLQPLGGQAPDTFVTLNPEKDPRAETVIRREVYEHPVFDMATQRAQEGIWSLQGWKNTWFCGAHFGSGFHEDGLQAGLAVAEDLGGLRRPWNVADESGRIFRTPVACPAPMAAIV